MSALAATVAAPPLAESFMDFLQLFARFLLALGEDRCRAICLGQVDHRKILDEYGRFKIWGEQSKADLPARARGSLDDTLRHDDELKQVVRDIFMRLKVLLSQALPVAKRKWDSGAGTDQDSFSSVSADSESSSDSDSDANDHVRPRQTMPKIKLLVRQIFEQIQSLYDVSSLLRRPKIVDRYIRSLPKSGTRSVTDSFPEELTLSVAFAIWDEKHVHEKLQQWQGVTKAGRSVLFDDEDVATEMPSSEDESPTPIPWLQERLARANTRRREQLHYWIDHPYDPNQDNLGSNVTEPELVKVQVVKDDGSQVSTLKKDGPAPPSQGPKSVKTTQSFSTVAMSDIHDTKTSVRPRTVYAPTEMGQGKVNSVPGPPKADEGKSTFTSPYGGMSLEWSEMQNRQSWKRHVFRDLRPYVCTFEDCQNGGKLYASRHDWTYHELQLHRREYRCRQCDQKHNGRKEMAAHLKTHYGDSFPAARLSIALDLCDRQVDILSAKDSCIFCGDELLLSALQGHIAAHMEDISLFVLPSTADNGDAPEAHSKASIQASWTRTWSSPSRQTSIMSMSDPEDQDSEAEKVIKEEISKANYIPGSFPPTMVTAVRVGDTAAVRMLLENGANPDDESGYLTPLAFAAQLGHRAIVRLLLNHGANPNKTSRNASGMTPLMFGVRNGDDVILKMLLKEGAEPNERDNTNGSTALMYAVREGKDRLVKVLLERGARPDDKDVKGSRPLVDAIRGGQEKIVRILLDNGARPNLKDDYGVTPLLHAAWKGDYAILECLLDHGADTDASDWEGNTPLIAAVQGGHEALVQRLVDHGADTEARHNDGNTALSYATERNDEAILQILKEILSSRPAQTTTANRATFACPLAHCTHPEFKDRSDLDKHIEAEHGNIYICIFEFAGCRSTFSNKDVWKKHVASEHLLHDYYVCNELHPATQDQSMAFRGKDLYTRHVLSAHMGAIPPDTPEWASRLQRLLLSASKEKLPQRVRELGCPGKRCDHWRLLGYHLWDHHMDHIARHLEASQPVHFGGPGDQSFVKWASDPNVGIIRPSGKSGYELNPVLGLDSESERWPPAPSGLQ